MSETRDYTIAAVDRALSVLEALAEQPEQGVTELSRRLGLTKTIVFRLLSTLEARGFVVREGEKAVYSLGYRIGVLGEQAGAQNSLLAAARPVMERLRDATSENINLVIREAHHSLVLATLAGRHSMRIFANPGRYGPLHAGGGSLLLLAFAPEELRESVLSGPLERFTATTVTDPQELRERLDTIRADGFHIAINDLDEGAFSIAAPIRNAAHDVIASLSVAGAMARYDETKRRHYLDLIQNAAAEISGKLGLSIAA
ncbi:MAG: IclR family transcriptional regulator [Pseudomonadota bacterium]